MYFEIISFAVLGFLTNGLIALILIPITAIGAVITPALQAMMSKVTPDSQQGELQGVLTSLHALSMVISPLLMTSVFARFIRPDTAIYLPGAPFLLALVLMVAGYLLFFRTRAALA